jgi:hypothetical protein
MNKCLQNVGQTANLEIVSVELVSSNRVNIQLFDGIIDQDLFQSAELFGFIEFTINGLGVSESPWEKNPSMMKNLSTIFEFKMRISSDVTISHGIRTARRAFDTRMRIRLPVATTFMPPFNY